MTEEIRGRRIRNGQIRRDFKRLLTILASADLASADDYAEVERIAGRHALRFDDDGIVREVSR